MIYAANLSEHPIARLAWLNANAFKLGAMVWLKQAEAWRDAVLRTRSWSVGDVTIYFPFGQGYQQDIEPQTNWGWIGASATHWPELEEEIVRRVASYGTQLDMVMELLLDIAHHTPDADKDRILRRSKIWWARSTA